MGAVARMVVISLTGGLLLAWWPQVAGLLRDWLRVLNASVSVPTYTAKLHCDLALESGGVISSDHH